MKEKIEKETWWNKWRMVIIINLVLIVVEYAWFSRYSTMIIGELGEYGEWNWGWAIFFAQVLYNILSFKIVGPTELGAIILFGKPLYDVGSGLYFVPFPVYQLVKDTKNVIEDELPAKPELIYRSKKEEAEVLPENLLKLGFKPPNRIQFGWPGTSISIEDEKDKEMKKFYEEINKFIEEKKGKEEGSNGKKDPLNVRMTVEVPFTIIWKIKSLVGLLKIFGSREEARNKLQDIAIAMLNRDFSKITPAVAQYFIGRFSQLIKKEITERIEAIEEKDGKKDDEKKNSIEVMAFLLRPLGFSHELNDDLLKQARAETQKQAMIIGAEGQKEKDMLEGQGKGSSEKAILDGRTEGILNMVEKLGVSPELIINTETARKITENPGQKTIIIGSKGFTDLMAVGSALGLGETLKGEVSEKGKEKKDNEKDEKKDKRGKEEKK
ncbi:MAG: hypothetical protein AAB696_00035 [Patescibacteria group bacterium]